MPFATGLTGVALSSDEEHPAFMHRALNDGFVPIERLQLFESCSPQSFLDFNLFIPALNQRDVRPHPARAVQLEQGDIHPSGLLICIM